MTHPQKFATLRKLWTLLPLGDISILVLYTLNNLFHQSKLGRDFELQNTHIDPFKSPPDVHQVATITVQLGLGSALIDWYRDATSVPIGYLLTDLSPRTDGCFVTPPIAELFHQNFM